MGLSIGRTDVHRMCGREELMRLAQHRSTAAACSKLCRSTTAEWRYRIDRDMACRACDGKSGGKIQDIR
jgi:hypothetical protein